jgi:hypothetical protein
MLRNKSGALARLGLGADSDARRTRRIVGPLVGSGRHQRSDDAAAAGRAARAAAAGRGQRGQGAAWAARAARAGRAAMGLEWTWNERRQHDQAHANCTW